MESSQSGRVSADCWWHFCRNKASCLFQVCLKRVYIATGVYSRVRSCQYSWNTWVILDCDYKQFFSPHPVSLLYRRRRTVWEKYYLALDSIKRLFVKVFLLFLLIVLLNTHSLMVFPSKQLERENICAAPASFHLIFKTLKVEEK